MWQSKFWWYLFWICQRELRRPLFIYEFQTNRSRIRKPSGRLFTSWGNNEDYIFGNVLWLSASRCATSFLIILYPVKIKMNDRKEIVMCFQWKRTVSYEVSWALTKGFKEFLTVCMLYVVVLPAFVHLFTTPAFRGKLVTSW